MNVQIKQLMATYQQLSRTEKIIAEVLMFTYMANKTEGIRITSGKTTDLEGKKKLIYQIEVEEE